ALIKNTTASHQHILFIDMHHIVSDGISAQIFLQDFISIYYGKELPPLSIQYKDFSHWQNEGPGREFMEKQESYWLDRFKEDVPHLNLPTDYPRPEIQSLEGSSTAFEMETEDTAKLKQLVRENETTLYIVMLALYNILLANLCSQEDIVVGTPSAGRRHSDLENIIGMFINTLALRNYPAGGQTVPEFLAEVKATTLGAFENQDYPFEILVDKAGIERDPGRNPLFNVMLVMQNQDIPEIKIPGLEIKPFNYEMQNSKFDMSWYCMEAGDKILFSVTYSNKLFKAETLERYILYFKRIVTSLLENPAEKISRVEYI
ncbi:MAG: non-ribosomal peptide synthetase, partial [bacterium]|nr:non-ribosomal peptide synthetase [bacterium]